MAEDAGPRNPFEGVSDYFSELSRMRHTGMYGRDHPVEDRQRTHASAWVPTTDIYARGLDLVIAVELAGVSPEEVDLSFSHGVLTVSGNRRADPEIEHEAVAFYVRERFFGEFRRAITLPDGTDRSQITAVFGDGLVEVTVQGGASRPEVDRIELRSKPEKVTARSIGG